MISVGQKFKEFAMRKLFVAGLVGAGFVAGCQTVNEITVREMPTSYLCQYLDANTWITTQAERSAIFKELRERKADCILRSGTSKPAGT